MSTERDVTRVVRSWLDDGATRLPDHVLDRVLADVPANPQRRRWAVRRNRSMSGMFKFALGAAAVAVVVAGLTLLPRSNDGIGDNPTPSPSPTQAGTLTPSPGPTQAGTLTEMGAIGSDVKLTAFLPLNWSTFADGPVSFAAIRGVTGPPVGMSVYFYAPRTTYADPCTETEPSPPVGPTTDDLVQALREIPNITTTEPEQTTFAGLPATYFVMTSDDTLPCAPTQFSIWDGNYAQGPGQVVQTWVLTVNGSRIVASALSYPESTAEALAEQQSLLDSIEFK